MRVVVMVDSTAAGKVHNLVVPKVLCWVVEMVAN